ncbi:MAG: oligosaccharide flippase family protein [Candidatus Latescibacteria bacterium]|nr:oligosaccharide flippase family protein [Candidatus Latescibacterota bacterium]
MLYVMNNPKSKIQNPKSSTHRLLRHSAIYGLGLILNRTIDFLLLPLYTNRFTPAEYGAVALTLTVLGFGHVVYALGFSPAFLRYFALHEDADRRRMFSGATLTLVGVALILSTILITSAESIAPFVGLTDHVSLIRLAAGVLVCDTLTLLPYTILRAEGRAGRFVFCTFINTVVHAGLTVYLILIERRGVEAIFMAMLIASALNTGIVTMSVRRYVSVTDRPLAPAGLLRFGLPFVVAGLATVAIDLIDRVILERLMGLAAVGVYSAGYKIAMGMGLLAKAFEYAWAPFVLETAKRDDAQTVTTSAILAFAGVAGLLWLTFVLFGEQIVSVRLLGRPVIGVEYRAGARVIPPVMLAYILSGIAEGVMAGVYLRGRSGIVPVATLIAAGVNIAGNYLMIPMLGMMGAAYATVLSYAVLAGMLWMLTRRAMA